MSQPEPTGRGGWPQRLPDTHPPHLSKPRRPANPFQGGNSARRLSCRHYDDTRGVLAERWERRPVGGSAVTQPSPGDRAAVLLRLILQGIGKLINRRVGSAIRRLGDLLDGGGGILRSRVRHDGGIHAADLPLDEVQVGTGPGALVLRDPQLQADPVPHVQPAYPEPAAPGLVSRQIRLKFTKLFPRSRGVYAAEHYDNTGTVGSSPLARGLRLTAYWDSTVTGIIPARAGFTGYAWCPRTGTRDHPRSRGVYPLAVFKGGMLNGSSPLARGLPSDDAGDALEGRIIPARAGFTAGTHEALLPCRDHPRSRGVYNRGRPRPGRPGGSSPLARGLR